ncbi:serine hydroxymethyltransferase, mitochondrial, partial [Tanacetum coccineum]
ENDHEWPKQLNANLEVVDSEIANIIEHKKARQRMGLKLILSENFTSLSVMQAVGPVMTNKYSKGYPSARYYGGNEFIDMAETLCQKRSRANFQVYAALLKAHDRIMDLDLPRSGHLSHGYEIYSGSVVVIGIDEDTGYRPFQFQRRSLKKCSGVISMEINLHMSSSISQVIMEYLVNISKRRAFWSLNVDILKITILKTNTPYPSRKIRRIRVCTHQSPQRKEDQYAVSRRSQYAVFNV